MGSDASLSDPDLVGKIAALLISDNFIRFEEMASIAVQSLFLSEGERECQFSIRLKTKQEQLTKVTCRDTHKHPHLSIFSSISEWRRRYPSFHLLFTDPITRKPMRACDIGMHAKRLMKGAGIDTLQFSAYSLKAAGLSHLRQRGTSMRELH
jgi:hypothetical protein